MRTDILVIGSGVAGLTTALSLAERGYQVVVVSKTDWDQSNSYLAQGGVAGAFLSQDSPASHAHDTMVASRGLADRQAVDLLTREARQHLLPLVEHHVFASDALGRPHLEQEAGHGHHRIWHAPDGFTGRSLTRWLYDRSTQLNNVAIVRGQVQHLMNPHGIQCEGAWVDTGDAELTPIMANHTVLATGGFAGLFPASSNPPSSSGDGLWLAYQAGAVLADLEFIQFHPTVLADTSSHGRSILLTEALRGAGGWLINGLGERIMAHHPHHELAPRDQVARAVFRNQPTYLTLAHLSKDPIRNRFSALDALLRNQGWDLAHDHLPVQAGAHFTMGGVVTDMTGRTTIARLWAVGEVARSGVHGANRLASNSLLEGLVVGTRCAETIALQPQGYTTWPDQPRPTKHPYFWSSQKPVVHHLCKGLGVERSQDGLDQLASELKQLEGNHVSINILQLVVQSAQRRMESRGAHIRLDYPTPSAAQEGAWVHVKDHPPRFVPLAHLDQMYSNGFQLPYREIKNREVENG